MFPNPILLRPGRGLWGFSPGAQGLGLPASQASCFTLRRSGGIVQAAVTKVWILLRNPVFDGIFTTNGL